MTQPDLFSEPNNERQSTTPTLVTHHDIFGARLTLVNNFLTNNEAKQVLKNLVRKIDWHQPNIYIAGREIPIPRKQAWYGDKQYRYTYSGKTFVSKHWLPELERIRDKVEAYSNLRFNSALCNLYRDNNDSVSWHADDERELGTSPIIASYSLGQARKFRLKPKHERNKQERISLDLADNSLLIMGKGTQEHWVHEIPKSKAKMTERVNITFRLIV